MTPKIADFARKLPTGLVRIFTALLLDRPKRSGTASVPLEQRDDVHDVPAARTDRSDCVVKPARSLPARATLAEALRAAIVAEGRWSSDVLRRAYICEHRFGLTGPPETLEQLGIRFGLTRERIRQIVERSLDTLRNAPFLAALRSRLNAVLEESECVPIADLPSRSEWFGGIDERALRMLLEALVPDLTWDSLVAKPPRAQLERAIGEMYEFVDKARDLETAANDIERLALEAATRASRPPFARSLAMLARQRLASKRRTFTDFARAYIERSSVPIRIADVQAAAASAGFTVSVGQVRNTVSNYGGMFPLGASTFATYAQLFREPSAGLDVLAARAEAVVRAQPGRQFHAQQLLEEIRRELPDEAALAGDAYRFAALLRARTALQYVGRFVFSAQMDAERIELVPLAKRVLQETGEPLSLAALLQEMRKHRDVSPYSIQGFLAALVEVRRGVWGLPGRDDTTASSGQPNTLQPASVPDTLTRLATLVEANLREDAFAALRPGETVAAAELRSRLIERGSEDASAIEPLRLRALLATDERFRVSTRGIVSLSEARFDERFAS